ncbi:hypothetical protein [Metallosphaera tengchongensis]|nr:hypothetical protein [Metallosphaera tengchongensis]
MGELELGKDDEKYVRVTTGLDNAHHNKSLAESLQKYDKRWKGT